MKYIINKPNLSKLETKYVLSAIKSTWLSSNGKNTRIFENKFSKLTKNKFSIAVQSGTSALHLALKSLNVKKDDNILLPNYTCVSNISTISQCGAKAILVDVEKETLGLDFELVKIAVEKYKPKVLQLVHIYGYPARDTFKIIKLCKLKNIKVIEDTSESLGAKINKRNVGTFGNINVTSIRSEKMIGVGEGAVISTNNKTLYSKILLLASRGAPRRTKKSAYWEKYYVSTEGYNYLMPHLLGSIARGQIERFKKYLLPKKIHVGKMYAKIINEYNFKTGQKRNINSSPVFWLNSIIFNNLSKNNVRKLGKHLERKGIEVRSGFWPLNLLKNFKSVYVTKNNVTNEIFEKILILPSSFDLKDKEIKKIMIIIKNFIKKLNNLKNDYKKI
jgi:dTDP-4-amino-4,6-dideoxygalactose transaminase